MNEDGVEGALPVCSSAEKDHAGDPEEDDVIARDQRIGRVEIVVIGGVLRPAEGGKGPQSRGEPSVERVLILMQVAAAACGADVGILTGNDGLAAVGRSTRRGCGGPTTADGRCTSP